ncbi:hydrolase, alpha/beta fold family protein [Hyphomonas neptunium ATCC 15444]|uniref:Palmitoyl-protein thioesterase ABHD10, mitochondrial n=2 Tax=Hyphomonas TaxID=85 RepID=Q0C539_HYPNA|nr:MULTISPECIES: alpha/beta hydrolase [Hyphomonas]ABI78635.1 hydrolase, alpha/beta fold family protein [Hyphomonas neptunium ATCC 15444]KCZ95587.1 alpha/beta fold family hydrolase [Hyphomonas hirschiana VP5]
MTTEYFTSPEGRRLAFRKTPPVNGGPTLIWLSGYRSDMSGGKAQAVKSWAWETGNGAVLFDYSGHGESDGRFEDGTISTWREDALAAIDTLSEGPVILVGSSMGGWIALLAALARPQRVKGLVLIAPAPDFTEKLMWAGLSLDQQDEVMTKGVTLRPSDYGTPDPVTKALIEDGRNWQLLDSPIEFDGPVRILQGMEDPDVPWPHALELNERLTSSDTVLTLIKDGDHRLSRDQDMARLIAACAEVVGRSGM